jgi:hypothetical protein
MARVIYSGNGRGISGVGFSGNIDSGISNIAGINKGYQTRHFNFAWTFSTFLSCLFLFAILAVKVAIELRCTELSYVLAHQQKRTVAYEMERRELDLQLSILQRSDVLAEQAEQLGLKPLKAEQIRVL